MPSEWKAPSATHSTEAQYIQAPALDAVNVFCFVYTSLTSTVPYSAACTEVETHTDWTTVLIFSICAHMHSQFKSYFYLSMKSALKIGPVPLLISFS